MTVYGRGGAFDLSVLVETTAHSTITQHFHSEIPQTSGFQAFTVIIL